MAGELIESVVGHPALGGAEFLVLRGELGSTVLWNVGYPGESEAYDAFVSEYVIDGTDYLGDPAEEHYQGTTFTRLIRRKSDGKVFGASYWWNPGIDMIEGSAVEVDLDALGVTVDWENSEPDPVVFLPVRKFVRLGYEPLEVQSDK
ncbi:hypothetical protein SEA_PAULODIABOLI_332 [Microbacterium phage PauloDiaboli]|nr:hypothetical protein SEA_PAULODIABOLI_332 [Microbacterium phage PauloDiaboli]